MIHGHDMKKKIIKKAPVDTKTQSKPLTEAEREEIEKGIRERMRNKQNGR